MTLQGIKANLMDASQSLVMIVTIKTRTQTIILLTRSRLQVDSLKMRTVIKLIQNLQFQIDNLIKRPHRNKLQTQIKTTVIEIMSFRKSTHLKIKLILMIDSNKIIKVQRNNKNSIRMFKKMNNHWFH